MMDALGAESTAELVRDAIKNPIVASALPSSLVHVATLGQKQH
jgi:hypothetical protein